MNPQSGYRDNLNSRAILSPNIGNSIESPHGRVQLGVHRRMVRRGMIRFYLEEDHAELLYILLMINLGCVHLGLKLIEPARYATRRVFKEIVRGVFQLTAD